MEDLSSFLVGDKVIFRRQGQWFEGRVVEGRATDTYRVQEFSATETAVYDEPLTQPGATYDVLASDIEVLPNENSIMERLLEAQMKPPEFEDPYRHLYVSSNNTPLAPDTYAESEHVEAIQTNLDGSQTLTVQGGRTLHTAIFQIPQDPMLGVEPEDLMGLSAFVSNRRSFSSNLGGAISMDAASLRNVLWSILSAEQNFQSQDSLREKAQQDPAKMLQLADMTRYGVAGFPRDSELATKFYLCAAWGCSEQVYESSRPHTIKFGYPRGPPEALTAAASVLWKVMESVVPGGGYAGVLHYITRTNDQAAMGLLATIVFFLSHAIRRDLTAPLALALGQAMREAQFLDPFIPDSMQLLNALECRNAELEKPREMARPSQATLELFRPKATEIFIGLPARSMNAGSGRSDVHIVYREMPFPPYPVMVLMINPPSQYVFGPFHVPEEHEYTPYCRESFDAVWGQIVFAFHMGDKTGRNRQRPALLTLFDKPGDREFAKYIREQIGGDNGSEIRLVSPDYMFEALNGRRTRLLDLVEETEARIVEGMRQMMNFGDSPVCSPIEQANTAFHNRVDMPIEELLSKLEALKTEGNHFFSRSRLHAAQCCYSEAIDLIRASTNVDTNVFRLLGTLLSNRAACFLKMSENMNPQSAQDLLKRAETDCERALTGGWVDSILPQVLTKLERRKAEARRRIDRLASRFGEWCEQHLVDSRRAEQTQSDTSQISQQQSHATGRRGGSRRRRNETQRQRQRRRRQQRRSQNSQRQRAEANRETVSDYGDEQEDTSGDTLIFIGCDLLESRLAMNATEAEDPCPCCLGRFRVELHSTHTSVLACGHACCVPCLSKLCKQSIRSQSMTTFACPICRVSVTESLLSDLADAILPQTPSLHDRLACLPLLEDERSQVGRQLLDRYDFSLEGVLTALDSLLIDNLQSDLRQAADLTPEEKQTIYEEARRPVDALFKERQKLRDQLQALRDHESDEYMEISRRVDKLEQNLIPAARQNASEYIWSQMNKAGNMGRENKAGVIEVDFHALHVDEAKEKFDESVLPILPVVGKVMLIVGRGNHSEGGVARLKPAIKDHINQHPQHRRMRCKEVAGNDGAIQVLWKSR